MRCTYLSGGIYIPPEILRTPPHGRGAAAGRCPRRPSPAELGLTERQMDVLALMMQGKSNKAICRVLDLAEPTVKNHVTAILKALKVTNRTEAVIAVGGAGLGVAADRPLICCMRMCRLRHPFRGLQQLVERGAQRHRRHRLVQQVEAARVASRRRSGAVSPVMRKAGIGRAEAPRRRSMPRSRSSHRRGDSRK